MKQIRLLILIIVLAALLLPAVAMAEPEPKVTICHLPPGNPDNVQIITIGVSAVDAHFANHPGDVYWDELTGCGEESD